MAAPARQKTSKSIRVCRRLILLGALSAACFIWAVPAQAAEFRGGQARQEITGLIEDDVYTSGETITVPGVVSGDLIGFGRRVVVGGTVGGSLMSGAESVEIAGNVGQSARVGSRTVEVSGSVGGDLLAGAQSVLLTERSQINRDVVVGAQDVEVRGQIRNLRGGAESLTINGTVRGNVEVDAERVVLEPGARIEGDLIYTSRNDATVRPGAVVLGRTERRSPGPETVRDAGYYLAELVRSLVGPIILGLLALWLVPGPLYAATRALRSSPLASFGIGLLALVVLPFLILLLFILASITGAGFSVPFVLAGILAVLLLLAKLIVGLTLGGVMLRLGRDGAEPTVLKGLLALILGVVLLALLSLIPILGGIVSGIVVLLALGAVPLALIRWRRGRELSLPAPGPEEPAQV